MEVPGARLARWKVFDISFYKCQFASEEEIALCLLDEVAHPHRISDATFATLLPKYTPALTSFTGLLVRIKVTLANHSILYKQKCEMLT